METSYIIHYLKLIHNVNSRRAGLQAVFTRFGNKNKLVPLSYTLRLIHNLDIVEGVVQVNWLDVFIRIYNKYNLVASIYHLRLMGPYRFIVQSVHEVVNRQVLLSWHSL